AVRQDHVVDALEGGARDGRVLADQRQVVVEGAGPVQLRVLLEVLERGDLGDQRGRIAGFDFRSGHRAFSFWGGIVREKQRRDRSSDRSSVPPSSALSSV